MASSLTTRYSNKTYGCATVKRSERFKRLETIAKSKIERSDNHDNQQICTLQPKAIDSTNFSEYGQIASWQKDGEIFSEKDLQLKIRSDIPRLYIFRVENRGLSFNAITYHGNVTQCLMGLSVEPWYLAVSTATMSLREFPSTKDIEVFQIPSNVIVKLNVGVWHAGPFFEKSTHMDFLSLELSDTNIEDHNTHSYITEKISFHITPVQK